VTIWVAQLGSWVAQTFASQKVCGLSRPEGAVSGDSEALIAFGMAKSRRPWKTGLRYKSARHLSLATVLWDGEKPQTLESRSALQVGSSLVTVLWDGEKPQTLESRSALQVGSSLATVLWDGERLQTLEKQVCATSRLVTCHSSLL
jgi:hypothetical protein